ncbi:AraC family transcriptional regulator [Parapedobacter sp. DT-150]|uniref:AraC family transcriptional regulator n=1 Tax=Parapedobacter sp. DT-150 TaxID=3396162 RepID=UPI003F1D18DD
MESYHKYLPTSNADEKWGLTLLNVGYGAIPGACAYPNEQHPTPYQFKWEQGRILQEYQLIYISAGSGIFESTKGGVITIDEGSIILLFPDEWHRYKPHGTTGWIEYWVGFSGNIADNLIKHSFFTKKNPVLFTGVKPDIIRLYQDIISYTRCELPGYQPLVSGCVLYLLGMIYSVSKQQALAKNNGDHQRLVQKATAMLRESAETDVTMEGIADQLKMSYSLFRKVFKKHTGIAPGQYLLQLKVDRAKHLLLYTDKLVKEIAYDLNFESEGYFSKFFKEKTGVSPLAYKKSYSSGA